MINQFDVDVMPSSFLVNPGGLIISHHRGFLTKDTERYRALTDDIRWLFGLITNTLEEVTHPQLSGSRFNH